MEMVATLTRNTAMAVAIVGMALMNLLGSVEAATVLVLAGNRGNDCWKLIEDKYLCAILS